MTVLDHPLVILPNWERVVTDFLRAQPELVALVDDRVYTSIPKGAEYPLVRVTQITDGKVTQGVLWITDVVLQVEGYGGSKAQASSVARTCEGLLAARIRRHVNVDENAVIVGYTAGGMQDIPDDEYEPARPRFLFGGTITGHPIAPIAP